jgi:hypothetical protein
LIDLGLIAPSARALVVMHPSPSLGSIRILKPWGSPHGYVQAQVVLEAVRIGINLIQPRHIEREPAANDAVHLAPVLEQHLREVQTMLAGKSGDYGFLTATFSQIPSPKARSKSCNK